MRSTALLALLCALALLVGGCGRGADPREVLAAIPEELLDRGVVWQPGGTGAERLLDLVGLSPEGADGTVISRPPAVVIVAHRGAGDAVEALEAAGWREAGGQPEGWRVLTRASVAEANLGIPAVGVGPGLVVAGDVGEIAAVQAQVGEALADAAPPVPTDLLSGAVVALLGTPAAAGGAGPVSSAGPGGVAPLPAYRTFLVTGTEERQGAIALILPGAGQEDAVSLAVRVSTATLGEGLAATTLLRPGAPLADGDRVVLPVEWLVDPGEVIGPHVDGGFAALLEPAG